MDLIIKHIELCNFGMFRSWSADFDSERTVLAGSNGTGKSTIANSIQWLLVGKSTDGRTQFALKTHDKDGKEIPKADHYVKADVLFDGQPYSLTKGISEKWTKVKGEDREVMSNQTYYRINEEPCKKTEWDAFMARYIKEPIFKAVSNPSYFVNLDWKTQRAFLYKACGGITNEEICGSDASFDPLLKELEHTNINDLLQSYGYQIKELRNKLELIPIRIAEQQKAMPEKKDWEAKRGELGKGKQTLEELNTKIAALKSGNAEDAHRKELDRKLSFLSQRISNIQISKENLYNERRNKSMTQVAMLRDRVAQETNNINDLKAKKDGLDNLIKRAEQAKAQAVAHKQSIEAKFEELRNHHLEIPENISFCPTCGQILPPDQIEEKRNKMQENFNKQKVEEADGLKAQYKDVKKDISDAENTANNYQAESAQTTTKIMTLSKSLEETQKELDNAVKEQSEIQSADTLLQLDDNYQSLLKEQKALTEEYDKPITNKENTELIASLEEQAKSVNDRIEALQSVLAEEKQYNIVQKNINDIETERAGISSKITKLEQKMDIALDYSNRLGTILEEKVNGLFSICKWKMFKTYLNGNKEDFCEVYGLDGSAYHDTLNTSMKLNIGIDICNTLSRIYKSKAPIVVDNAEASVMLLTSPSQLIVLRVENHPLEVRTTL